MAIETTLQPRFKLWRAFLIALFLVMGLWGLYDYTIKIPRRERAYYQGQLCFTVKTALEAPPGAESREIVADAKRAVDQEISALVMRGLEREEGAPPPMRDEVREALRDEEGWLKLLLAFHLALEEAESRPPGSPATSNYGTIFELAERAVGATAGVTRPNKVDRATQWAFILCLPCVPWLIWQWVQAKRRVYRLEDDGTLRGPGFAWTREEIADVDMRRWMAKSVAHVVHRDGARVKLDDYVHRNTHLIVGAIASRLRPEEWDAEARVRKSEEAPGAGAAGAPQDDAGSA